MGFTSQVKWDGADFAVAALLLGGGAAACELAVRFTARPRLRRLLVAGVLLGVALVWAEAAVGVFPGG